MCQCEELPPGPGQNVCSNAANATKTNCLNACIGHMAESC